MKEIKDHLCAITDPFTYLPATTPYAVRLKDADDKPYDQIWESWSIKRALKQSDCNFTIAKILINGIPKSPIITNPHNGDRIVSITFPRSSYSNIKTFINQNAKTLGFNYEQLETAVSAFKKSLEKKESNAQKKKAPTLKEMVFSTAKIKWDCKAKSYPLNASPSRYDFTGIHVPSVKAICEMTHVLLPLVILVASIARSITETNH